MGCGSLPADSFIIEALGTVSLCRVHVTARPLSRLLKLTQHIRS